jgi:hypothetical protein
MVQSVYAGSFGVYIGYGLAFLCVYISECPFWHSADYSVCIYGKVNLFVHTNDFDVFLCRCTMIVIPLDISIVDWDWILVHDAILTININDYFEAYNCKNVSDGCDECCCEGRPLSS